MDYFLVEPEVAGGIGPESVVDTTKHPPVVTKLHYQFDGWLGDVLIESFPVFIITEDGREVLERYRLSGMTFEIVATSRSQLFMDLHPGRVLPAFHWMKVHGQIGRDDFALADDARLVMSHRALSLLRDLGLEHAVVKKFAEPGD